MFSLLPYSAAQQPVQCRLQAEVGSIRMAQGMLQPYFSFGLLLALAQPMSGGVDDEVLKEGPAYSGVDVGPQAS